MSHATTQNSNGILLRRGKKNNVNTGIFSQKSSKQAYLHLIFKKKVAGNKILRIFAVQFQHGALSSVG